MKLKAGYVDHSVYDTEQRVYFEIILTPDGHVWPREDAEEKHPECFESKSFGPFRIGIPVSIFGAPLLPHGYGIVCDIVEHKSYPIRVRFQDGRIASFCRDELKILNLSL